MVGAARVDESDLAGGTGANAISFRERPTPASDYRPADVGRAYVRDFANRSFQAAQSPRLRVILSVDRASQEARLLSGVPGPSSQSIRKLRSAPRRIPPGPHIVRVQPHGAHSPLLEYHIIAPSGKSGNVGIESPSLSKVIAVVLIADI